MQGFMQKMEIDGTPGRGGQISVMGPLDNGRGVLRRKKAKSKG